MLVQIPIELQHYIIGCLEQPSDLAKVALISKHFHQLSLNPSTWQTLVEKKNGISLNFIMFQFSLIGNCTIVKRNQLLNP